MKLTHPKTDQVIEVEETSVDVYLSQGWKPDETKTVSTGKKS